MGCSKGASNIVVLTIILTVYYDFIFISKTLLGPFPSKVDSLAFTLRDPENLGQDDVPSSSDLRLFSSGGGSDLLEWDIKQGVMLV